MNKGSKVAGRVERKGVSRVGYEPSFMVNLAASMKQVDVHTIGTIISTTVLVLERMVIRVM